MGKLSSLNAAIFLRLRGDIMEAKKILRGKKKIVTIVNSGSVIVIIGEIRE